MQGSISSHDLNTLALWQKYCSCIALQQYPFPCKISTISCIIIIILCHANEKYRTTCTLLCETFYYSRKNRSISRVLISNTRGKMHFTRFSVWLIRSLFQVFGPLLMPIAYRIITRTYQASLRDRVYKSVRGCIKSCLAPLCWSSNSYYHEWVYNQQHADCRLMCPWYIPLFIVFD